MRRILRILFLALLAGATAASARDQSDQSLADARHLVAMVCPPRLLEQIMLFTAGVYEKAFITANPDAAPRVRQVMVELFIPELRDHFGELAGDIARLYAANFTDGELKQLIAFYETPLGQKLVQSESRMSDAMPAVGAAWAARAMLDIVRKHPEQFRQGGLTVPKSL